MKKAPYLGLLALSSYGYSAGILVTHSEKGFQFADAVAITVNGKDKVLSLGADPKLTGPANKLSSQKLGPAMLMDADAGTAAFYENGVITYVMPDGAPKNAPSDPASLWRTAKLTYKKSTSDKTPAEVDAGAFTAFVPDGLDGLARLCADERVAQLTGGKAKTLGVQLELIAATVRAYSSSPALAPLERYVAQSMRERYERFENGFGGVRSLEEGLRFGELSQSVYASAPGHADLRKALTGRKGWLDRKIAVLRGFSAAQEWDAFLLGARDFDRYHHAYPEIASLHTAALKQSLQLHRQAGEERQKDGQYGSAYREFLLASRRQPSDSTLDQKILMAWTDYSRQVALDRQGSRKQLSPGQLEAIQQSLSFAARFKEEGRLDRAMEEIRKAEDIDAQSLPVLLKKAEILAAQREFTTALKTLDEYDLHAMDEERPRSSQLRNAVLFDRGSVFEKLNAEFQKAWTGGAFHKASGLARQALAIRENDPQMLYQAGLVGLMIRDPKNGQELLKRYLEVSNTLDAKPEHRTIARRLQSWTPAVGAGAGSAPAEAPNWLSGQKLGKGAYYCPISLAFQPRVDRIEASNKFRVVYEWESDRLKAISPTFEGNERATGERKIFFGYDARLPLVHTAAYESGANLATADPDERFRNSSQVLLNHPDADPLAIRAVTGSDVTVGISGNRFFHPFVWDKIHYFRLSYDAQGRVARAREIGGPRGAPGDQWLEFEWDGLRLLAVRGYQGMDEKQRIKNYERTMQYQGGRLVSEEIHAQGKTSRIKYNYNASRLVSAECDRDVTLDGRSRDVTFLANSPTVMVQ